MKLGFIGLGKMGKPMAVNLLNSSHDLTIWNRSLPVMDELTALGAVRADSPARVGELAEVIFLCLPTGQEVAEVVCGKNGILDSVQPGTVIVDHSTISPAESKSICGECRLKGAEYLDAPVSGGVTGAQNGTLSIMVGGDESTLKRVRVLLEILGQNIYYMGESGSGNAMKLVNNLLVGVANAALAEAFVLAVKSGLDPHQVLDVLSNATADSMMLRRNIPNFVFKRDFKPAFTLDMLNKDMALAENLARDQGVRLLLGALAHQVGREASICGFGGEDMSAVTKVLENLTKIEIL
ncbi:3-hydroxyisobutyrate dehydrogenase [Syntrophobotulus glycolicus DSM 8271]|uniref:3-hydroxyisobutyrate dehydrogenase n=1 Tax=Syntrophobotulus glycolicus (strain DSM 8271 / FlGlyR) TaxID=645991 RepID=F0SW20_SYNGF|nr:NAD(P)-dependent oxidoreductase [Syntrophobotulus glycolicus]ADY56804.1 3-hydroxyisobutyrate dehydrogenase [Syntrophobotulus glycolicus DSM 8271]